MLGEASPLRKNGSDQTMVATFRIIYDIIWEILFIYYVFHKLYYNSGLYKNYW